MKEFDEILLNVQKFIELTQTQIVDGVHGGVNFHVFPRVSAVQSNLLSQVASDGERLVSALSVNLQHRHLTHWHR